MDTIKGLLKKEIVRYVIVGGCTTAVNLVTFSLLRLLTDMSRSVANVIAIICAMIFAFFANKFCVFTGGSHAPLLMLREFVSHVGARLLSMIIEVIGTNLLCDSFNLNELLSKILVQFAVVVVNYILGKCFVFKKDKKPFAEIWRDDYILILSFVIPALFMLGVWIAEKIGIFGGNSLTMVDSLHQYLPFFADYHDKLTGEKSIFYSWNVGLGSNFLAIISYYLSCPLNFIIVLFKRENLYAAMSLLISFKIAMSGFTFAYYLGDRFKDKKNCLILVFSTAYALSNYVIGYSWNVMWMDCIMILPLVMAGYHRLMEEGDYKLYTFSLFYALLCNYYIAFMICIFLVMYFFLTGHKNVKKFFLDGLKFAGCSLLGAGLSAFILVPAYVSINTTASAARVFPKFSWYGSIWEMIKQMFVFTKPIKSQPFDGGVNLYCGTICFVLVFLYILNGNVKLYDKIRNVLLLVFLMVSFNNELLNYIWHGFHNQYGIPNRFSFLFIFVLLDMGYEALKKLDRMKMPWVIAGSVMGYGFFYLANSNAMLDRKTVFVTSMFLVIYIMIIFAVKLTNEKVRKILVWVVLVVCLSETILNAAYGYDNNGYVDISHYFSDEAAMQDAIDLIDPDDEGYRVELMGRTVVDEPTYYSIKNMTLFGSTVSADLVDAMHSLGYYTGANEYLFDGSNPVNSAILNLRYLLKRPDDYNSFDVNPVTTVSGIEIYENPYRLSTGFMVNRGLHSWDGSGANMFYSLNDFVTKATGVDNVFEYYDADVYSDGGNCEVTRRSKNDINYNYTRLEGTTNDVRLSFEVKEETVDLYMMANANGISKIRIFIDDQEVNYDRLQYQIYHLGHLNRGTKVTVQYCFRDDAASGGTVKLILRQFDREAWQKAYGILSSEMLDVSVFEEDYVKGTITTDEDGLMFTSIPYDAGWKAYVDGEEYAVQTVRGAFIAIDVPEGTHTVEFKYFPPGLKTGLMISALALVILGILLWLPGRKKMPEKGDN